MTHVTLCLKRIERIEVKWTAKTDMKETELLSVGEAMLRLTPALKHRTFDSSGFPAEAYVDFWIRDTPSLGWSQKGNAEVDHFMSVRDQPRQRNGWVDGTDHWQFVEWRGIVNSVSVNLQCYNRRRILNSASVNLQCSNRRRILNNVSINLQYSNRRRILNSVYMNLQCSNSLFIITMMILIMDQCCLSQLVLNQCCTCMSVTLLFVCLFSATQIYVPNLCFTYIVANKISWSLSPETKRKRHFITEEREVEL